MSTPRLPPCRSGSACSSALPSFSQHHHFLLPRFEGPARFDTVHGDATVHGTNQRTQIAAHAFVFIHARNPRKRRRVRTTRAPIRPIHLPAVRRYNPPPLPPSPLAPRP